jgi:hypothetical protein
MTPNTEKQLADALAAIAHQFEMESYAKGDKCIHNTIEAVERAAEAVSEDAKSGGAT